MCKSCAYLRACDVVLAPKPPDRLFKVLHLKLILSVVRKIQFSLISDKNDGNFT
jgi:hypothetical protein